MSSFYDWIDKGLLDALFSGEKELDECSEDRKYSEVVNIYSHLKS